VSQPNGIVTYKREVGFGLVTGFIGHTTAILNYNLQCVELLLFHTVCLQFSVHTLSPVGLLSVTIPLIPVSNVGRSPCLVS
jgi:hypothetical protein